jgi:hypothetical protein
LPAIATLIIFRLPQAPAPRNPTHELTMLPQDFNLPLVILAQFRRDLEAFGGAGPSWRRHV